MKQSYPRLPDAELEVMKALWSLEDYPAHTGDIAQKLDRSWKAPTLIKLLSRLEERGFVASAKEGRANVYTPLVQEGDYLASESRSFLMAALYPDVKLTQEDVAALERILEKGEK